MSTRTLSHPPHYVTLPSAARVLPLQPGGALPQRRGRRQGVAAETAANRTRRARRAARGARGPTRCSSSSYWSRRRRTPCRPSAVASWDHGWAQASGSGRAGFVVGRARDRVLEARPRRANLLVGKGVACAVYLGPKEGTGRRSQKFPMKAGACSGRTCAHMRRRLSREAKL